MTRTRFAARIDLGVSLPGEILVACPPPPSVLIMSAILRPTTWRNWFDRRSLRFEPYEIVTFFALVTAAAGWLVKNRLGTSCAQLPVSIIRIEVAFHARQFADLLRAEHACAVPVVASFFWDILFAIAYPFLLGVLFLWAERYRRFAHPGRKDAKTDLESQIARESSPKPYRLRSRLLLLAAALAGFFDILEDVMLGAAGLFVPPLARAVTPAAEWFVEVGSTASVIKWLLLMFSAWGTLAMALSGPRGAVLRRIRFSVLAVALGGLPLLVIPQGQDMLRRLVEGALPLVRALLSTAALAFAAFVVWRCGRTLLQLELGSTRDGDNAEESRGHDKFTDDPWGMYFALNTPRLLAGTLLALGAAAMANEAGELLLLLAATLAGLALSWVLKRIRRSRGDTPTTQLDPETIAKRRAIPEWDAMRNSLVTLGVVFVVFLVRGVLLWRSDRNAALPIIALDAGAWACLAASWLLTAYVYTRKAFALSKEMKWTDPNFQRELEARHLHGVGRMKHDDEITGRVKAVIVGGMLLCAGTWIVFSRASVSVGQFLGPLWILAILVASVVFIGSYTVYANLRWNVPVVRLLLVFALVCSIWNDNHLIATTGDAKAVSGRDSLGARLTRLTSAPSAPVANGRRIVLVAAAGGGLRAAYWTALALAKLQDEDSTFGRDVVAISGVSGGSLGAALFVALRKDAGAQGGNLRGCGPALRASSASLVSSDTVAALPVQRAAVLDTTARTDTTYATCVRAFMQKDFLSPLLARMTGPDFFQRFFPIAMPRADRSRALEDSWSRAYADVVGRPTFDAGLTTFADPQGRLPILLLNSTHVESGRRYVASPYAIHDVLTDAGDELAAAGADLPLSSAVHNSARFTFASPAGAIVDSGSARGRLVDGGYFENSGLVTLADIYEAIVARDANARIVVVYLCNDPTSCSVRQKSDAEVDTAAVAGSSINELLSPGRALMNTRDARASLARARLLGKLHDRFVQLNVCNEAPPRSVAATGALLSAQDSAKAQARTISPPLGWLLSAIARDWMDGSLSKRGEMGRGACRDANRAGMNRILGLDSASARTR